MHTGVRFLEVPAQRLGHVLAPAIAELDGIVASTIISKERMVPVILVSAYHEASLVERAGADHVIAYLVKPIVFADLQPTITIAMRRFAELQALQNECADLKQALTDRKQIERAKGVLMKVAGIDEKEAFGRLQALASDSNRKLIEAAQQILGLEKAISPLA